MKKLFALLFLFFLVNSLSSAQITVTPINKYISCCGSDVAVNPENDESINLDNDTIGDLYFLADGSAAIWTEGFYTYAGTGMPTNNYRVTLPVKLGDTISKSYNTTNILSENYYDADYWGINEGFRYIGVRKILGADTNYGWIKLEYIDNPNSPNLPWQDTIRIIEYALNSRVNEPIFAGQLWTTVVINIESHKSDLDIFPNPVQNVLFIKTESNERRELYNFLGQLLFTTKENEVDVSKYSSGLYYIKCGSQTKKFVIE